MSHLFYNPHRRDEQNRHPQNHFADKLIYPVALIAPIMTIPQLLTVWIQRESQGVSLLTWCAYTAVSGIWIIYGLYHKEKPIILTNLLLFVFDASIVLGVLFYK